MDLSAVCGGGGSRRTTQRIFGNECSRYFGSAENYDESLLDQNEVYSFEGLEESGNARMLQEMTLRVFVYDGTLTFALRTDNNAAAAMRTDPKGDDGWFKTDNYRIESVAYEPEDVLCIYTHFRNLLDPLYGETMQDVIGTEVERLMGETIDNTSSQDGIIAAIKALKACYPLAKASAEAYGGLNKAYSLAVVVAVYNIMAGNNPNGYNGDVNEDGAVDIADVVAIYNIMAGGMPNGN